MFPAVVQHLQEQPDLYSQYHEGFRRQAAEWPQQPVDAASAWLKACPVLQLSCSGVLRRAAARLPEIPCRLPLLPQLRCCGCRPCCQVLACPRLQGFVAVPARCFADSMPRLPQAKPKDWVVADFGCGDAHIAAHAAQRVHSFDLVAGAPGVSSLLLSHIIVLKLMLKC